MIRFPGNLIAAMIPLTFGRAVVAAGGTSTRPDISKTQPCSHSSAGHLDQLD